MSKANRRTVRCCIILAVLLTIIRIGMLMRTPATMAYAPDDDYYYITVAERFLQFDYLGPYQWRTFIKGISYPLFLALSHMLMMPYFFLLGLYLSLAAFLIVYALKDFITHPVPRLLAYFFFLYSPVTFSNATRRIYRQAILYPAVLIVIALALLICFGERLSLRRRICCLTGFGLAFSWFWFIREDSVWLLPFFVCALLWVAVKCLLQKELPLKKRLYQLLPLLLPPAVFLVCVLGLRTVNYMKYGIFLTNDRTDGAFGDLISTMTRIADADAIEESDDALVYWITRDKMLRMTDASPSLSQYKDLIAKWYGTEEVKGDHPVWRLRGAFQEAGLFSDARAFQAFCAQADAELKEAVQKGVLSYDKAIHFSGQSCGIYPRMLPKLLSVSLQRLYGLSTFDNFELYIDSGNDAATNHVRLFEAVTAASTYEMPQYHTVNLRARISLPDGARPEVTVEDARAGLQFTNTDTTWDAAAKELTLAFSSDSLLDLADLRIKLYRDGALLAETYLADYDTPDFKVRYDLMQLGETQDENKRINDVLVQRSRSVIAFWHTVNPFLLWLSLLCFVILLVRFVWKREVSAAESVLIPAGLALSAYLLIFGVSVFSVWMGWDVSSYYGCAAVALTQSFQVCTLAFAYPAVRSFCLGLRAGKKEEKGADASH